MLSVPISENGPRNDALDAVKGIGIILVVVGHCFFSFTPFIYLFHMSLFFLISGYLWTDQKAADLETVKRHILSRAKHLWLPFFLCNAGFSLLNNFFLRLGIYSNNPAFTEQFPSNILSPHFDFPTLCLELVKHVIFLGDTQLGTATWFLRTLFFVSVAQLILRYIAQNYRHGAAFYSAAVIFALAGTAFFAATDYGLPGHLQSCFPGYTAFWLGTVLRRGAHIRMTRQPPLWISGISFVVLLFLNSHGSITVSSAKVTGLLFYVITTTAGWFFVYPIALHLPTVIKTAAACLGRHSLWIVTLHYLAFKPVTFLYLYFTGGDMLGLAKFPVFGHLTWLKIFYAAAGIILPLAPAKLYSFLKKRVAH